MKNRKLLILVMVVAGALSFYKQSKDHVNLWIMIIVIFIFEMIQLSTATLGKKDQRL